MKNIHVLPTDKHSKLVLNNQKELWFNPDFSCKSGLTHPQHIYIISDEKPKVGDWVYCIVNDMILTDGEKHSRVCLATKTNIDCGYKIILTTDQDLIKDGVQAIDDEFLEWFVKNANESGVPFDRFEIEKNWNYPLDKSWEYKIIIPQEEPKCLTKLEIAKNIAAIGIGKEEPKQETLEEAARTYGWRIKVNTFSDPVKTNDLANSAIQDFTEGAKWQAERMYSEEDARAIWMAGQEYWKTSGSSITFEELTEQLKKKKK